MGAKNTNARLHRQAKQKAKQKQKRDSRAKDLAETKHARKARLKQEALLNGALAIAQVFPEELHLFWLAQGLNYLSSDYDTGVWAPLFPEIYEGQTFSGDALATRLASLYYDESSKNWKPDSMGIVGWCLTTLESAFLFYITALKKIQETHPDEDADSLIQQPHQPTLWAYFNGLKKRATHSLESPKGASIETEHTPC